MIISISGIAVNVDSGETLTFTDTTTPTGGGTARIGTDGRQSFTHHRRTSFTRDRTHWTYTVSDRAPALDDDGYAHDHRRGPDATRLFLQLLRRVRAKLMEFVSLETIHSATPSIYRCNISRAARYLATCYLENIRYQIPAIPFLSNAEEPGRSPFRALQRMAI